eukprot:gene19579-21510_t
MSLVVLCFPCCVDEQPPPRRRPKIDRTMIGEPMGFKSLPFGACSNPFDVINLTKTSKYLQLKLVEAHMPATIVFTLICSEICCRQFNVDSCLVQERKHTGHIGSGEIATGFDIHNVQDQMQSKGGYDYSCNLSEIEPEGVDLKHDEPVDNGGPGNNESNQSENTKEHETHLAAQKHDNEVKNENNTNQDNVETLKPDDTNTIQQANQL